MLTNKNIPLIEDYKSVLADKIWKKHKNLPAYLYFPKNEAYQHADLLTRYLKFLEKKQGEWISENKLQQLAIEYPSPITISSIERLKEIENIGYVNRSFTWYPPSVDAEFRQAAVDNFDK